MTRIAPSFIRTVVKPTEKSLREFVKQLHTTYQNLSQAFNGGVSYGDGTNTENINGSWVNVIAPGVANTNFTVTHGLNRTPVGVHIMQKDRACDVWTVSSTKTTMTLQASVASAVLRLFIFCLVLGLFSTRSEAQGANHTNIALKTVAVAGSTGIGGGTVLQPISGATITVCNGSTLPSSGSICIGLANIFSNVGLTSALSNPTNADNNGNYTFWVSPNVYVVSVSGTGLTTYSYAITPSCNPSGTCTVTAAWSFTGTANSFTNLDKIIHVDGQTYAFNPTGIQAAINAASALGGATVIIDGNGTPIAMGGTGLTLPSKVCVRGNGTESTILQWSGNVNAFAGTSAVSSCVTDMHLDFTGSSNSSSAIRFVCSDASFCEFNNFENLHITFVIPSSGSPTSAGFFITGSGPSGTDFVLNTIRNVTVENANQMVSCQRCEGNFWQVRGQNLGTSAGQSLVALTNATNEIMDLRIESGSSNFANAICFNDDAASQNNIVRMVCDANLSGVTALSDSGTYNLFDLTTIGSPTLGSVAATSQYRYTSSYTTMQNLKTGNLLLSGTLQDTAGHIQGLTVKKGSGTGNYTSASTSFTAVDGTNLTFTVTVPTGWKLGMQASGAMSTLTAAATASVILYDGTCGSGTAYQQTQVNPTAAGNTEAFSLSDVLVGDGASHTINLCYSTSAGADSVSMLNSSASAAPRMIFTLIPSN